MDMMERLVHLFRKFHQLKISNEEYVCMKAINFLNQGKNENVNSFLSIFLSKTVVISKYHNEHDDNDNEHPLCTHLKIY